MNIYDLFENAPQRKKTSAANNIEVVREFAPAGGGGAGDYLKALASAWYNGIFNTGSLPKGIKTQQDVERLLNRGIVCPDGVTRKMHIDYNSDFDGVEIYSDDYYEHGDHDATIDSRTGQKWGPYDHMEFSDDELSEGLNEFAPPGGDEGGPDEDEILFRLAKQWWLGTESDMIRVERTLASMGWEIGEDEGSYDDGGVFVVRAGDENGRSYQSWPHEELVAEGVAEAVDIGQEWMSDTELDQYVPDRLQQQWRELLGYDQNGNPSALWVNLTGGYEPDVRDPEHRALMVKVANKWFTAKKIPNVKFYDVKDADDELEWLVQIGSQDVAEGWQEQAQDFEDWTKEVNKKLYKAHASQRPALARQLSKIENQNFNSELNKGGLTRIVHSALTALRQGDMAHYDSDKVGQTAFGQMVGTDARDIADAHLGAHDLKGYSALKQLGIVKNVDQFLKILALAKSKGIDMLRYYGMSPEEAWTQIAKDVGWSKQGVAEEKCPHCAGPMFSEMMMMEKKDACYYKVKSRYSVWPSAYASGALVKCRKKGAANWGNGGKKNESIEENLHDWFGKEKWVRVGTDGKIRGDCAREPGEGKPKCLPQAKAHALGKKGRASAAQRKRRQDPNPERSGKAINVNTKKKTNEGIMDFMQPKRPETTKDRLSLAAMRQIEKARADKERQDPKYVRSVDLPKNPDHVRVVTDARGDYVPPKEADYGAEYQDMVRRVAAQEKRKQQPKPQPKRENSNMPVAVDSTSPIHGMGEDRDGVNTKNISPASQKLIQKARQAAPDARSDLDAVFAYLDDVAKRTQDNYGKVNDILQQLDPLSNDLDRAEQELSNVRQVNQGQQQLLGRLKARLDKTGVDAAPAQAQAQQDKRDAGERDAIGQQLDQQPKAAPVVVAPGTDADTKQQLDKVQNTVNTLYNKDLAKTSAEKIKGPYAHQAKRYFNQNVNRMTQGDPIATQAGAGKVDPKMVSDLLGKDEISEDIYESRLYKMKLAGYFD